MSDREYLPHQQRVIEEKQELDSKIQKLMNFIETSSLYEALPAAEQVRLCRQAGIMNQYAEVLSERIAAF